MKKKTVTDVIMRFVLCISWVENEKTLEWYYSQALFLLQDVRTAIYVTRQC